MSKTAPASTPCRDWLQQRLRGEHPAWPDWDDADAALLLAHAQAEGVAGLLAAALDAQVAWGEVPASLREALQAGQAHAIATELLRLSELKRIIGALDSVGLPWLLLKGSALAYDLYPAPHLRPRGDTDVVLADTAAVAQVRPALVALGYHASAAPLDTVVSFETSLHRATPAGTDQWLDLHWAASNSPLYAPRLPFTELWEARIPIAALGERVFGLCTVHALALACAHRVRNLPAGDADRLIWLYDIHLLALRLSAADWTALIGFARAHELAGAIAAGLASAHATFRTALPAGPLDELERLARGERFDVAKAHRRAYQEWHNLLALAPARRWRWLREVAVPGRAYMLEQFPQHGHARLLRAHLQRWGNGIRQLLTGSRRRRV